MPDKISPERRSWNMSRIRSIDTLPEMIVRKILFKHGYKYRLHKNDLPGKPDIVLNKYKKAVFINGCFWHRHEGCKEASKPKTNSAYWEDKINKTIIRDHRNYERLSEMGWQVVIIWECELKLDQKELEDFVMQRIFYQ